MFTMKIKNAYNLLPEETTLGFFDTRFSFSLGSSSMAKDDSDGYSWVVVADSLNEMLSWNIDITDCLSNS